MDHRPWYRAYLEVTLLRALVFRVLVHCDRTPGRLPHYDELDTIRWHTERLTKRIQELRQAG